MTINKKKKAVKLAVTSTLMIPAFMMVPLVASADMTNKEVTKSQLNNITNSAGITPLASMGTGYSDKFKNLENTDGVLTINTNSSALLAVGFATQTKTTITVDPEFASEFFSTPDYKQYLGGSVDRLHNIGIGNSNVKIQKLWDKKTGPLNGFDTAYFDEKINAIVIFSEVSVVSANQYQNVNLEIDLDKWSKDTGRLVERKDFFNFKVKSGNADLGINWSWGAAESVLNGNDLPDDTWIENKVKPTTITSEDEMTFTGVGYQPMDNEHDTNYFVTLEIDGKKYKNIQLDSEGNWQKTFDKPLGNGKDKPLANGTVVKAYVEGTETEANGNGIVNTKVSAPTFYTVGEDSTSWADWEIKTPTLADAYDEETIITGNLPEQNHQNGRTYETVVTVNDVEKQRAVISGESGSLVAPLFDEVLQKGDVVKAYIIGHEEGETDKESLVAETVVQENKEGQESWENWTVEPTELETVSSGDEIIRGVIPIQNKFNGRTYDVEVLVNDKLVATEEGYTARGGEFSVSVPDSIDLKYKDKVTAIVVGHELDKEDKDSEDTTETVKDVTDHENWKVAAATINDVKDTDTFVSGTVPVEDTEFDRNYEIEVAVNDEVISTQAITPDGDYKIDLPKEVKLAVKDNVTVTVVGHQVDFDDVSSDKVSTEVIDGTNWSDWKIANPELDELTTKSTAITGEIAKQDIDFDRNYTVTITQNGTEIINEKVESDSKFNFELPEKVTLEEDDEIAITVEGHQKDKESKLSETITTKVKDASNWADWKIVNPELNNLTVKDTKITGNIPQQAVDFGRNYSIEIAQNGEKIISEVVKSEKEFSFSLPKDVTLAEGDEITATLIGHQDGKENKKSENITTIVEKAAAAETTSEFKLGYWEKFGLVYEGKVNNDDWDLTDKTKVEKTVSVTDSKGQVVKTITAANTDWYKTGQFDGYQFIVNNDVLGDLAADDYSFTMNIKIDGVDQDSVKLELNKPAMRSGAYHDKYNDLESVVLKENKVSPFVSDNSPAIKIEKFGEDTQLRLFNKYWNNNTELVFDGYVTGEESFKDLNKTLEIKDSSNKVVKTIENLHSAPTSWGIPTSVGDDHTFQAIIPKDFGNEKNYAYALKVLDKEGKEVYNFELK